MCYSNFLSLTNQQSVAVVTIRSEMAACLLSITITYYAGLDGEGTCLGPENRSHQAEESGFGEKKERSRKGQTTLWLKFLL